MIGLRNANGETMVTINDNGELNFTDKMVEEAMKDAEKAQEDNKPKSK